MRKIFEYDFDESKRKITISTIVFIIAFIYVVTTHDMNDGGSLWAHIVAAGLFGFLIGGFPYGWKLARAIMRPHYNEFTDEYYYPGGIQGIVILFPIGFTLGLFVGGILFAIDIIRTILYLVINRYKTQ